MTSRWTLVWMLGAILLAASPAFAQSNSLPTSSQYGSSTSSGLFGSRSVGSSVTAGNRTTTGSSASGGLGNQQASGQLDGSERYVRGNRSGAFVGADTADASNPYSQQQQGAMRNQFQQNQLQQMLGMNRNQQAQMLNQQMQGNQGGKQNREIRAILNVDFDTPTLAPGRVAEQAQKILVRAKPLQGLGTIQVGVRGRVAVLTGTVHSERARKLAEQLVLLEPGISGVENELKVVAPPAPPAR